MTVDADFAPSVELETTEPTEVVAAGTDEGGGMLEAAAAAAAATVGTLLVLLPKLNFHFDVFLTIGVCTGVGVGTGASVGTGVRGVEALVV